MSWCATLIMGMTWAMGGMGIWSATIACTSLGPDRFLRLAEYGIKRPDASYVLFNGSRRIPQINCPLSVEPERGRVTKEARQP